MKDKEYSFIGKNIQKKIITNGKFGRKPSIGWSCKVTFFYEKENTKENVVFTIGNGSTERERLLEFCVQSMYQNEESSFIINLDDELLNVHIILDGYEEKPYIFQWSEDEKLEAANNFKTKGTELFKKNNIKEAFYKFSLALKFTLLLDSVLETDEPNDEVITSLRTALYNNLAGCHLHFKNFPFVIKLCSESLKLQPTSKAYYRRALANIELLEYEKAEMDLIELLKIEPKNKAALEKYKLVRNLDKSNRDNYEAIVKNMFR